MARVPSKFGRRQFDYVPVLRTRSYSIPYTRRVRKYVLRRAEELEPEAGQVELDDRANAIKCEHSRGDLRLRAEQLEGVACGLPIPSSGPPSSPTPQAGARARALQGPVHMHAHALGGLGLRRTLCGRRHDTVNISLALNFAAASNDEFVVTLRPRSVG